MRNRNHRRLLSFESCEDRRLLAADLVADIGVEVGPTAGSTSDAGFDQRLYYQHNTLSRGVGGSLPMQVFNDRVYFSAGGVIYATDGESTQPFFSVPVDDSQAAPARIDVFHVVGDKLYFTTEDPTNRFQPNNGATSRFRIWVTDGKAQPQAIWTKEANVIASRQRQKIALTPFRMNNFNGNLLFGFFPTRAALFEPSDENQSEIWLSDGTQRGTSQRIAFPFSSAAELFLVRNRAIYIANRPLCDDCSRPGSASDYYSVDLTNDRTATLLASFSNESLPPAVSLGDNVFFAQGRHLWMTDGTAEGTKPQVLFEGNLYRLLATTDRVYFGVQVSDDRFELYQTDGVITNKVLDVTGSSRDRPGAWYSALDDQLYIWTGTNTFREIYVDALLVSNAESPVPQRLLAFDESLPVARVAGYEEMARVGDELFFSLKSPEHGLELWKASGDEVELIDDIYAGAEGSRPSRLTPFGDGLLFTASDEVVGEELHRYTTDESEIGTADLNNDSVVNFDDFLILSQNFGRDDVTPNDGDINRDGRVSFHDFLLLSAHVVAIRMTE